MGGDNYKTGARLPPQDLGQYLQPRLVLEPEVEEDDVEGAAFQGLQGAGRGADAEDAGVVRLQAQPDRLADAGVVVDNHGRPRLVHRCLSVAAPSLAFSP